MLVNYSVQKENGGVKEKRVRRTKAGLWARKTFSRLFRTEGHLAYKWASLLYSKNEKEVLNAAGELAKLKDRKVEPYLVERFNNPSSSDSVKIAVAEALAKLGNADGAPFIIATFSATESVELKRKLASVMKSFEDETLKKAAFGVLSFELFNSEDEFLQAYCVHTIAEFNLPSCVHILVEAVLSEKVGVKAKFEALQAIGELGDSSTSKKLLEFLKEKAAFSKDLQMELLAQIPLVIRKLGGVSPESLDEIRSGLDPESLLAGNLLICAEALKELER